MSEVQNIILYASWLVFPGLFLAVYFLRKFKSKTWGKLFLILFILGGLFFIWIRFIERFWVVVNEIDLNRGWDTEVVLIADMHLGVYKSGKYLDRVVRKINQLENIDAVLIAGDLTYEPKNQSIAGLKKLTKALSDSKYPVFAVMGNHDVSRPGPVIKQKLIKALAQNKVTVLENQRANMPNSEIQVLGLGNH